MVKEKLSGYTKWEDLINLIHENSEIIGYKIGLTHDLHYGLAFNNRLPHSISEYEFNFMKNVILNNNLKNGYELATGIGISSLSIGYALGMNGGNLITVDSYMEDLSQNVPIGDIKLSDSDEAFFRNKKLFESFGLTNIHSYKGFSPECCSLLDQHFNNDIDFVFLDCPKDTNDFIRDITPIKNRLSKKYVIFVHDVHCFFEDFKKISKELFGIEGDLIYDFLTPNGAVKQTFPLGVITNIKLN